MLGCGAEVEFCVGAVTVVGRPVMLSLMPCQNCAASCKKLGEPLGRICVLGVATVVGAADPCGVGLICLA